MTDTILIQMSKFDFDAPVQTITVFDDPTDDDTDDDSCSPSKRQKVNGSDTEDNTCQEAEIVNSANTGETHEKVTLTVNDCVIEYNLSDLNKTLHNSQVVGNKENITNVKQDQNKIGEQQRERDDYIVNQDKNTANNESVTKESMPEQVNIVSSRNSQKEINELEILSSYVKKLLDTVSENLIMILRAHRYYMISVKSRNQTLIEKWRQHFMQLKHHYFKLSFAVVETILIPQSKFENFTKTFIECTERLANGKSLNFSYKEIEPFYLELLRWTKDTSQKSKTFVDTYMAKPYRLQPRKSPTNETGKNQYNIQAQTENMKSINIRSDLQKLPDLCNQNQPSYPVLRSLIGPQLPSYEETINLQHNNNNHNQYNSICGAPRYITCNSSNHYLNTSRPGYVSAPTRPPWVCQNCIYCQQSQWHAPIEEHTLPAPVISHVTSLDPHYTG